MKRTVNFEDFRDAFEKSDRKENFSYEGLHALFEYIQQTEEDTGEEIEMDIIAICCDWMEYENEEEALKAYPVKSIEDLASKTEVRKTDKESYLVMAY